MSKLSEKLMGATSKGVQKPALLALADGTYFEGKSCGAPGTTFGEICFNTSLEGYLEVITDPSYAGQIITMTYPQIGNYGVALEDCESARPALRGLVVGNLCPTPSNWRSEMSLGDFLVRNSVVAIEGLDTRALVRHIREAGAMTAAISTEDLDPASLVQKAKDAPSLVGANLVAGVSALAPSEYQSEDRGKGAAGKAGAASAAGKAGAASAAGKAGEGRAASANPEGRLKVVAYDCGAKKSILEGLTAAGCDVTVVPWNTPAEEVLAANPAGVFLSNGPGDPDAVSETFEQVKKLIGRVPIFGICLGHQMLCKAAGAKMVKLKYGHRGGNHPVMNLLSGRVEITAQNHGFNLDFSSLGPLVPELSGGHAEHFDDLRFWSNHSIAPVVHNESFGKIQLTHVNLNDGTAEGIAFLDNPAFSVQYHPEANPGPTDSGYLFTAFRQLMEGRSDYLAIDIAKDRLAGWEF